MENELKTLIIDPEFRDLIPPLTDEERGLLESSILKEGCETPLVIWNGAIVDGHNRYEICHKHSIHFAIIEKAFADRREALLWIITNQLGRRNLNSFQRGELVMKFEPLLKAQARERQATSTGGTAPQLRQNSGEAEKPHPTTDRELGKLAGVSHDTIHKVKKLSAAADDETKRKLRRGEMSVNRAYTELMHREHAEETRTCTRCNQEKSVAEFRVPSKHHDFFPVCKTCEKEIPGMPGQATNVARPTVGAAEQTAEPASSQPVSSIGMHKGHPIHVATPLPDRPDMFPNVSNHMRFIVGSFLANARNAIRLYTPGMASPDNTEILREILESANGAVEAFDEYVREMLDHE